MIPDKVNIGIRRLNKADWLLQFGGGASLSIGDLNRKELSKKEFPLSAWLSWSWVVGLLSSNLDLNLCHWLFWVSSLLTANLEHLGLIIACRRPRCGSWVGKIPWKKDRLPTPIFLDFPCSLAGRESACNVGDLGLIPGLGITPGEGKGYWLQYSGLENSMDCIVLGVTKSRTRLSNFHFHIIILKYWLYSPCCAMYLVAYLFYT